VPHYKYTLSIKFNVLTLIKKKDKTRLMGF
jgi:hypothetical protein